MKNVGIAIIILSTIVFLISSTVPEFSSLQSSLEVLSFSPQRFKDDLSMVEFLANVTFSYDFTISQRFLVLDYNDGTTTCYFSNVDGQDVDILFEYTFNSSDGVNRQFLRNLTLLDHSAPEDSSFWDFITTPFQLLAIFLNFIISSFFGLSYIFFDVISLPLVLLRFIFNLGSG